MKIGQNAVGSGQAASWTHFDHDADIGICGRGLSLEEAFKQAAMALTAIVTDQTVKADTAIDIVCHAPDRETLFVDWLNALVFEMATRSMLFSRFSLTIVHEGEWQLRATVRGEPIDRKRHAPAVEIKGATFTELTVTSDADGTWRAQCVLDV